MIKRKKVSLLIVVIGLFFIVMSSSIFAAQQREISYWCMHSGPDGVIVDELVKEFNSTVGKENNIKVNLLIIPWDEYYTKLVVAMQAGKPPETCVVHSDRLPSIVNEGTLQEISSSVLDELGIKEENFISALWQAGVVGGKRYGIPKNWFPKHIYYNKTLFKQAGLDPSHPPETLEEIIEYGQKIKNLSDDIWGLWFETDGAWLFRDFLAFYYQFNDNFLTPDQKQLDPNFAETAKKVFTIMKDFLDKYKIASITVSHGNYAALLAHNRLGIAISSSTDIRSFTQVEGLEFGTGPMPQFGDKKATFALGHSFVFPKLRTEEAERTKASLVFVKWYCDHYLKRAETGNLPASYTILNSKEFQDMEALKIIADQLDYVKTPPQVIEMPEISTIIADDGALIYAGKKSIEDAVNDMVKKINNLLAK